MTQYLLVNNETGIIYRSHKMERVLKAAITRDSKREKPRYVNAVICDKNTYDLLYARTKVVRNLMNGKEIRIDVNTPMCCDPSTELYWSM